MMSRISKRNFQRTSSVAPAIGKAGSVWPAIQSQNKKLNVLLLLSDEQCPESWSCYGKPWAKTPNIDRLAGGGAMFMPKYIFNVPLTNAVKIKEIRYDQ